MKNYAIIPIFIPHNGCNNDCVFCNQKKITAREKSPSEQTVICSIERNLATINDAAVNNIEIGFFGGSFTGIPMEEQRYYLDIAKKYKDAGKIKGIRLSTRPDYIDHEILSNLKKYSVDMIELGVQSFDEDVLRLSERGHDTKQVHEAVESIKEYGFDLGIQLMIGLPGDTHEKSVESAKELVAISPSVARLYPTVVLKDTKLMSMYRSGEFIPFTDEQMLETVTDMYEIITGNDINVIRIGLKSTDLINADSEDIAGDYHPAFSELVQGQVFFRSMMALMDEHYNNTNQNQDKKITFNFYSNPTDISKMIGQNGRNRTRLSKKYPHLKFTFGGNNNIESGNVKLTIGR